VAGVHGTSDGLGRFADPWLLVLTSLADGPKHGYAIMTDIAGFSGVAWSKGTLYGALSRLRHHVARRTQVTEGHPHNADERALMWWSDRAACCEHAISGGFA
jgi:hypothetical protein